MFLKKFILNSLKNFELTMIEIKEPDKNFLNLIEKEVKLQRSKNYSFNVPKIQTNQLANFIFFLRILDFRRWQFRENWAYKHKKRFWSLAARLEDLFKLEINDINFKIFKKIISPKEPEFLAKLRYRFFKENLEWLNKYYDGDFKNYFESHKNPYDFAMGLTKMKRFKDFSTGPKKLYFLKPNQFLYVEYLLATKNMKRYSSELKDLTVFADYRLPQLLMHFEIIVSKKSLFRKINSQKIIKCDSREEKEIRVATILSCELIRDKIKNVSSFEIDMALWNLTYKINISIPHFRSKSIFY